jgi:hypothetical protein
MTDKQARGRSCCDFNMRTSCQHIAKYFYLWEASMERKSQWLLSQDPTSRRQTDKITITVSTDNKALLEKLGNLVLARWVVMMEG